MEQSEQWKTETSGSSHGLFPYWFTGAGETASGHHGDRILRLSSKGHGVPHSRQPRGRAGRPEPGRRVRARSRDLLLADAYRSQVGFAEAARPHLLSLRNETKETVHLFVYERGEFYYLDKIESPYQVRMHSRIGGRASLFRLSAGKALLAGLSPDDLKELHEPVPGEVAAEFPGILSRGMPWTTSRTSRGSGAWERPFWTVRDGRGVP